MSDMPTLSEFLQVVKEKKDLSLPIYSVTLRDGMQLRETLGRSVLSELESKDNLFAAKGDICYNMMRMWQGASGLASEDCHVSPAYVVCRPRQNLDPAYASYLLKSEEAIKKFIDRSQGVTSDRWRLYPDEFLKISLFIPPLPEQKKIAEILSGIDKVLSSQGSKIRASEVLRKAIVSKHVESSNHVTEESKLGDLLLSIDSGWSPDCLKRAPANESEWSVLKTTSVTWNGFDHQERKALPSNLTPRPELVVEEGDILITRAGPTERTGVVAYADRKAPNTMISDKIIRLRCNSRVIDPLFLAIFLGTDFSQRQMLKGKVGMALSQTNISQQLLKDMTIRFPPLQEQKRISRIVSELQKTINNTQGYVERIENLKHSVSADLLSGRKRVTV